MSSRPPSPDISDSPGTDPVEAGAWALRPDREPEPSRAADAGAVALGAVVGLAVYACTRGSGGGRASRALLAAVAAAGTTLGYRAAASGRGSQENIVRAFVARGWRPRGCGACDRCRRQESVLGPLRWGREPGAPCPGWKKDEAAAYASPAAAGSAAGNAGGGGDPEIFDPPGLDLGTAIVTRHVAGWLAGLW